jgi:hypothetical protein
MRDARIEEGAVEIDGRGEWGGREDGGM